MKSSARTAAEAQQKLHELLVVERENLIQKQMDHSRIASEKAMAETELERLKRRLLADEQRSQQREAAMRADHAVTIDTLREKIK